MVGNLIMRGKVQPCQERADMLLQLRGSSKGEHIRFDTNSEDQSEGFPELRVCIRPGFTYLASVIRSQR